MVRTSKAIVLPTVGAKVHYLSVEGRKVTAIVESIDSVTHPSRVNIRITATKDKRYAKGMLINTPPAFVQAR